MDEIQAPLSELAPKIVDVMLDLREQNETLVTLCNEIYKQRRKQLERMYDDDEAYAKKMNQLVHMLQTFCTEKGQ